jgi:hypothetical protein
VCDYPNISPLRETRVPSTREKGEVQTSEQASERERGGEGDRESSVGQETYQKHQLKQPKLTTAKAGAGACTSSKLFSGYFYAVGGAWLALRRARPRASVYRSFGIGLTLAGTLSILFLIAGHRRAQPLQVAACAPTSASWQLVRENTPFTTV